MNSFTIDCLRFRAGSLQACLIALALGALAVALRWVLDPIFAHAPFGGFPYVTSFLAVILAAFCCGSAAAFLTTGLAGAAVWLIILPLHPSAFEVFQIPAFFVVATTVIAIIAAMRAANEKVRRLNENLRISEARLAEASQAKSEFLARMSHELRTPLNAIIGFSEMMREAMIGPLDARYRGYGADINSAGRHLQRIINDILDISKIEGGRLELRDEPVSIGESVEACRRIVAAMAEAASVQLRVEVPADLPPIRCDALRFRQILLNLMSNAVKFTPAAGRVDVSASIAGGNAVIAVADTGIGMKKEDIAIALEPFRQIDHAGGGALTRRFDGTGLGLPLAKALVELHGGMLEIESMPDAGTTVRIVMPLERRIEAAA
ncbi:MAG TPA: HAMP domain-containing sensor histidine kinase [Stellaceae bacterium]|nr:HAMP domain-containing sensor histidine kinase [Stellaceae bacterium]